MSRARAAAVRRSAPPPAITLGRVVKATPYREGTGPHDPSGEVLVPGRERVPPPPVDVWLIAGTPGSKPYPCMCQGTRACRKACPCNGRTDIDHLPNNCCGRRALETARRNEHGNRGEDAAALGSTRHVHAGQPEDPGPGRHG